VVKGKIGCVGHSTCCDGFATGGAGGVGRLDAREGRYVGAVDFQNDSEVYGIVFYFFVVVPSIVWYVILFPYFNFVLWFTPTLSSNPFHSILQLFFSEGHNRFLLVQTHNCFPCISRHPRLPYLFPHSHPLVGLLTRVLENETMS
jgi:hypothetical protein